MGIESSVWAHSHDPQQLRISDDPYLINDQYIPPEMRIQPSEIEVLLSTLREHHLVTDLTFPDTSTNSDLPIWGEFDLKLKAYLSSIGAEFANPSSFSSCDHPGPSGERQRMEFHNLPWLLLTGSRISHGRRSIVPTAPLTFSAQTLCTNPIGYTWGRAASGTQNQPLLLIGASI